MLERVMNKLPTLFLFSSWVLLASFNAAFAADTKVDTDKKDLSKAQTKISNQSKATKQKQSLEPITLIRKSFKDFIRAQNYGPMITTDRNSTTPHPNVVPRGYLQIESGTTFNKFNRGGTITTPETVFRLGSWYNGELRLQVPDYFTSSGTLGNFAGPTDLTVGIKQEVEPTFLKKQGWDAGVIAGMTLPTGKGFFTNNRISPFVQGIVFKRHNYYTLGTSHSIFMPSELPEEAEIFDTTGRNITYQPTVILFKHLNLDLDPEEEADLWVEWAGLFPRKNSGIQFIDMGALWRPLQRHQLDFRFGFGLSKNSPRAFLGVGYSWLPGKILPFYKRAPENIYRP